MDLKQKLDGIRDFRKIADHRLEALKQKVFIPRELVRREFLSIEGRRTSLGFFLSGAALLLLVFGTLSFVNRGLELKRQILGTATTGWDLLQSGNFGEAQASFEQARTELQTTGNVLSLLLGSLPAGRELDNLLQAGSHISAALELLHETSQEFETKRLRWDAASNSSDQEFYFLLKTTYQNLVGARQDLEQARGLVEGINVQILPVEVRAQFEENRVRLRAVDQVIDQLVGLEEILLSLVGGEDKIYLLVFQNNNEVRATGGFLGTYGILRLSNGTIRIERIESIYVLDGQLGEEIAPPGPLRRQLTQSWGTRDANWFVDFPTSARKILGFFEKGSGILADGVISFTPDVFEKLLSLTGPVEIPEYGETLTAENFRAVVQVKTSLDYDRELNQPKKFLADFAPRFLAKLEGLDQTKWFGVFAVLNSQLLEKQILLFSTNPELETKILGLGLSGEIKPTNGDYLAIFHSNVGGGKTDIDISQKVEKQVSVAADGNTTVNLRITRNHQGFEEKFFPKNVDFMRILVPAGSRLFGASGFDNIELLPSVAEGAATDPDLAFWDAQISRHPSGVYLGQEAGYTMFAGFFELDPGQERTVELSYELPFITDRKYTQVLQKQPGSRAFDFDMLIHYPGKIIYVYPERAEVGVGSVKFAEVIRVDQFHAVVGE